MYFVEFGYALRSKFSLLQQLTKAAKNLI